MAVKYCPNCGKKNSLDAVQCKKCNYVLPQMQQPPSQWSAQPQFPQQYIQQQPLPQQQSFPQPQPVQPMQTQPPAQPTQTIAGSDNESKVIPTIPTTMAGLPIFHQPIVSPAQPPASVTSQSYQQSQTPQPQYQRPAYPAAQAPILPQNQQPYPQTQNYQASPQAAVSQSTSQPAASPAQAPATVTPQPGAQPMRNCPSCGRFIPKGASVCPKCNPAQQSVQASPKTPDVVKPEPSSAPLKTIPQAATVPVIPLSEMPWDIQSPYPQEKQPADDLLPTDFACPNCGDKTVFVNRFSSYYCYRCKAYPWRCKSCKSSIPSNTDCCPKCSARRN